MNLNDLRAHAYGAASGKENDTSNGAHSNTENERTPQKPLFRDVNAQMDSIFRSSKKLSREEHPNPSNSNAQTLIKVPADESSAQKKDSVYRRVAKFLVLIGVDEAAKILPHLSPEQTEKIIPEIATIRTISDDEAAVILAEFQGLYKYVTEKGGKETARAILEKAYGSEKAEEMLKKAVAGKYAVGQFNINNLEWTKAILLTAQELNSPVILGVSEGAGKYMTGYKTVVGMVKGMIEELNITVPVALHLDHGTYDGCLKCIEAGFSSIMFDGSHYPIDENIAKTTELVKICKEKNMSLEAEVGSIGGEEDGVIGAGECADPNECKSIADLGVTMLAAGIGNIHGKYPANWQGLSFETLAGVKELTGDMPLVLHGGTGIPADMIKKAISLGVAKINVNTECQLAFQEATRKYIEAGKDLEGKGFDPRKLLAPGFEAIKATVKEKMELFGSVGKA